MSSDFATMIDLGRALKYTASLTVIAQIQTAVMEHSDTLRTIGYRSADIYQALHTGLANTTDPEVEVDTLAVLAPLVRAHRRSSTDYDVYLQDALIHALAFATGEAYLAGASHNDVADALRQALIEV